MGLAQILRWREVPQQFVRGKRSGMNLLEQWEADCKEPWLAPRAIQTHRRWVEEFPPFHH